MLSWSLCLLLAWLQLEAMAGYVAPAHLADCKGDIRLSDFTGRDEDWGPWTVKANAFFTLMGWDELLRQVEEAPDTRSVMNESLGDDSKPISKALHAVLTVKLQKKALGIMTLAGRGEGFHGWRMLRYEYEPQVANRFAAMLSALLNPPWGDGAASFHDALVEWANDIARYEIQSKKAFGDDYRVATLLVHAPEPFRAVLRNAPASARGSYVLLRSHLREWHASGVVFSGTGMSSGSDPMDVGAIHGHASAKGKEKGKDQKGKDKTEKGKDKGKGKGKGVEGQGQGQGQGSGTIPRQVFQLR